MTDRQLFISYTLHQSKQLKEVNFNLRIISTFVALSAGFLFGILINL